ncbi:hypothetical protein J6590_032819 [Homalodisca vitripennis]|nr:hypothetical protein J6590_032819 [Homalodisca vitripennis]
MISFRIRACHDMQASKIGKTFQYSIVDVTILGRNGEIHLQEHWCQSISGLRCPLAQLPPPPPQTPTPVLVPPDMGVLPAPALALRLYFHTSHGLITAGLQFLGMRSPFQSAKRKIGFDVDNGTSVNIRCRVLANGPFVHLRSRKESVENLYWVVTTRGERWRKTRAKYVGRFVTARDTKILHSSGHVDDSLECLF